MDYTEEPALLPLDDPDDGSVLIDPDLLPILERVRWSRKRKPNGDLIGRKGVRVICLPTRRFDVGRARRTNLAAARRPVGSIVQDAWSW